MEEEVQDFIDSFLKVCGYNFHVTNLIHIGKALAVERFLQKEELDYFSDYFLQMIIEMIKISDDADELARSWEALDNFYRSMIGYLENKEYYEMASNFHKFLTTYNQLVQDRDQETINA